MTIRDLSAAKNVQPKKPFVGKPSIGALMAAVSVSALCLAAPGVARAQDSNGAEITVNSDSTDLIFSSEADIDGSLAGVVAINNGSGITDISVTNVTSDAGIGISVTTASTTGELLLDVTGSISATGGSGVYVDHDGSEVAGSKYADVVDIDVIDVTASGGTELKYAAGIDVDASAGKYNDFLDVYITATGGITARDAGVDVDAKYANIDIDVTGVSSGGNGIDVYGTSEYATAPLSANADIDVTATGSVMSKYGGGIYVASFGSDIDIQAAGVVSKYDAISVFGGGSSTKYADITVNATGAITSNYGDGVEVDAKYSDIDIDVAGVTAKYDGIYVSGGGDSTTFADIDVGATGAIDADNDGVYVSAEYADIDIDVAGVTAKYDGIYVSGGGDSTTFADIDVTATGAIDVDTDAVYVSAKYADIDIDVAGVTAKYDGIYVYGGGDSATFADIDVTATGDIDAETEGVNVNAKYADVDIDVAGVTVSKYTDAVQVSAAGVSPANVAVVSVDTAGDVYGEGAVAVDATNADVSVTLGVATTEKYANVETKYAAVDVTSTSGDIYITVDSNVNVYVGGIDSKYDLIEGEDINSANAIQAYNTDGLIDVDVNGNVVATVHGVFVGGTPDYVNVATGSGSTVLAKYSGIHARNLDGGIYVYSDGTVLSGEDTINLSSSVGYVYVSVGATGAVTSKYGDGINAHSGAGDVYIDVAGSVISKYGEGVHVSSDTGAYADVTVSGTVTALQQGVVLEVGSGVDVDVDTKYGSSVTSKYAEGILSANKYSDVYINVGGDVTAYSEGVLAITATRDIDVLTGANSSITSTNEDGIRVATYSGRYSKYGDVTVTVDGAIDANEDGIDAYSKYGDVSVTLGSTADVSAVYGDAIEIDTKYGDVSVNVAGSVYSEISDAIDINAKYGTVYVNIAETGALYANTTGSDSSDHGVEAYADTEEIAVIVDGTIDAAGNGLDLIAVENRIEVRTGSNSSITGDRIGIYAEADASVEVTIDGYLSAKYTVSLESFDDDVTLVIGETGDLVAYSVDSIKYAGEVVDIVAEEDISVTVDGSMDAKYGSLMSLDTERGDITIDIGETAVLEGYGGIYAYTAAGENSLLPAPADITMTIDGAVTVEYGGIYAETLNGDVTITTGASSDLSLYDGINVVHADYYSDGEADDVSVTIGGALLSYYTAVSVEHVGGDVLGDYGDPDGGNVSVAVEAGASVESGEDAIDILAYQAGGDVTVNIDGSVYSYYGSGAVVFTDDSNISVSVGADGSVTAAGAIGLFAGKYTEDGIAGAGSLATVDVSVDGAVEGAYAGIYAESLTGGDITISTGEGSSVSAKYGSAISVLSLGTVAIEGKYSSGSLPLSGISGPGFIDGFGEDGDKYSIESITLGGNIDIDIDGSVTGGSGPAVGAIGSYVEEISIDVGSSGSIQAGSGNGILAGLINIGPFAKYADYAVGAVGASIDVNVDGQIEASDSGIAVGFIDKYVENSSIDITVGADASISAGDFGIFALPVVGYGSTEVTVTVDGDVESGGPSIFVGAKYSPGGPADVTVTLGASSTLGSKYSDGVYVVGGTVAVSADGSIAASDDGLEVVGAYVSVTTGADSSIVAYGDGIRVTDSGPVGGPSLIVAPPKVDPDNPDLTINIINEGGIAVGGIGIYGEAYTLDASVQSSGTIIAGEDGISLSAGGRAYVDVTGDITAGGQGIDVNADKYVSVDVVGDIASDDHAIRAFTYNGPIYVDVVGNLTTTDGDGMFVTGEGGDVDISLVGDIDAGYGWGIDADAYGGDVTVNVVGDIDAFDYGIDAYVEGGNVTINAVGDVSSVGSAIDAYVDMGAIQIDIVGDISSTYGEGIRAISQTYGEGFTASASYIGIDVTGNITATSDGIEFVANGNASINVVGDIDAGEEAIDGVALGDLVVSLDGDVTGDFEGILTYATGDTTIDILADGSVTGGDGTISDLAIGAYSEFGSVELSLAAGTVVNGAAVLGDGDDTFNTVHGNFTRIDGGAGDDVANLSGIGFTIAGSGPDQQFDNVETFNISGQNYVLTGDHSADAVVANFLSGSHSMIGDLSLPTITAADGVEMMLGEGLSITGDLISEATTEIAGVGSSVTIDGDLTLGAGSEVRFDVGNLRRADNIAVSGQVSVAGGIVVDQGDLFVGDVVLISSDTPVIGSFDSISGLVNGLLVNQSITIDNDVSLLSVLPDPNSVDTLTVNNVALALYTQTMAQNGLPQIAAAPNHPDKVFSIPSRDFARMVRNILDEDNADTLATTLTDIGAETAGVGSVAAQAGSLRFVDGLLSGYSSVDGGKTRSAELGNGHLWLQLGQSTQEFDPSDMIGFDADGEAIMAGVDDVSFGQLTLGGAVSFSEQDLDLEGLGRDEVDSEVMRLGAYASMPFETATLRGHVTGAVSMTDGSSDVVSTVLSAGLSEVRTGSTDFNGTSGAIRLGLDGVNGNDLVLKPYIGVMTDSYDQDAMLLGGGVSTLLVDKLEIETQMFSIGVTFDEEIADGTRLAGSLSSYSNLDSDHRKLTSRFASNPDNLPLVTELTQIGDLVAVEAGVSRSFGMGWNVELDGHAEFGDIEGSGVTLRIGRSF